MLYLKLFSWLILLVGLEAATDCRRVPPGVQNVQSCCIAPMPNWLAYSNECRTAGGQPSCRLSCIFNAARALNGTRLNMSNVRPMLERAYNNEPQLIEAYRRGFAECTSIVRLKYEEISKISKQNADCDRHALFYSLCAHAKLFKNCPSSNWQSNNKQCQTLRKFTEQCAWEALKAFMSYT